MSPEYFLREMGPAETADFLEGYAKRQHPAWEQARLLCDVVCKLLGGNETGIVFPWEKKSEVSPEDEMKQIEALRAVAKKMEKKL